MEAVLLVEVEIPSLRVIMEADLDEAECVQSWYDQLNLIKEKRLTIVYHGQLYQRCLKRDLDKKVLPREYRAGELVLKRYSSIHQTLGANGLPTMKDTSSSRRPSQVGL